MSKPNILFESDDNPAWYYDFLTANCVIAFASTLLSGYFILFRSPKIIGAYKYFLLNITLWAFGFDFYTTAFYRPKVMFPAMMMCPKGLMKSQSLTIAYGAFAIILIFYSASAIAVLSAFAYRCALLLDLAHKMINKKVLAWLGGFHIVYMFPTIAFYLLSIGNRKDIEKSLISKWPGLEKHFYFPEACSALSFQVTYFPYIFLVSCIIQFTLIIPAATWLIWKCFHTLMFKRHHMSLRTYRMHHQLLVTLVCQLLVPLATLILPNTFNACVTLFEIQGLQTIPQVLFILATLHSPLNTIMMIILIKPYRRFIVYAILRIKLPIHPSSISHPTSIHPKTQENRNNQISVIRPSIYETGRPVSFNIIP